MPTYRNSNTKDVVELDAPSARLDALANWERIDEPEAPAEPAPPAVDDKPKGNASREEWVAYAAANGIDDLTDEDSRDDIRALFGD